MQLIRDMAGLLRCLDGARLQRPQAALRLRGSGRIGRKPTDVDGQRSQLLADLIVQLARYSPALLFLSRQETGRQSLNFLCVCSRSTAPSASVG